MKHRKGEDHPDCPILPEIKVIRNLEELSKYKEVWNKILADNQNTNPFLEYDWIENWWNYLGIRHSLFIIILKVKERVVGICPFMIRKRRLFREITFVGYPEASYMDFILTGEGRADGVEAAIEYIRSLHGSYIFHLHGFVEESYALEKLKNYFDKIHTKFSIRNFEAPYFNIHSDFSSYFKCRSKYNSIKTLIRSKNKIENSGNVIYKQLNSSEIDDCFQLHEMRWKRKYDTSNFSEKEHRKFFRDIANKENLSFQVYVYGMKLGKRLIAFTFGFLCNGTYYFYRICHDNDFSVYGPGKIILMKLIEACFLKEMLVFDFGLGYARYKSEWTDNKNIIHEFVAPLTSGYSLIFYYMYIIRTMVIKSAKKLKAYNILKIGVLGFLQYFITGSFVRDMICCLRKLNGIIVYNQIQEIMKKLAKSIYQMKQYLVVENVFDCIGQDAAICDKSCVNTSGELNKDSLDVLAENKSDYKINEAYLDDLDFICEIMKEKPIQIIQRFFHKQRCFQLDQGIKGMLYVWVNSNQIDIPDLRYNEDITDNKTYIDLTKVDVGEDSMINILHAIHYIMNILYPRKCTECYIGFKLTKASPLLKTRITDIGFKSYKYFVYKKFLYRSYLKIKPIK